MELRTEQGVWRKMNTLPTSRSTSSNMKGKSVGLTSLAAAQALNSRRLGARCPTGSQRKPLKPLSLLKYFLSQPSLGLWHRLPSIVPSRMLGLGHRACPQAVATHLDYRDFNGSSSTEADATLRTHILE